MIIGDLDSLNDTTREYFEKANTSLKVIQDKDVYHPDFAKAVRHVRNTHGGTRDIVAMGGLGGRVDQGLSQIHNLYKFQESPTYDEGRLYLISSENISWVLKAGSHKIHVREPKVDGQVREELFDKYAGILPVKQPAIITLKGFEWDVQDWPTEFGGANMSTSNHVLPESEVVEVITNSDVLFTIALRQ